MQSKISIFQSDSTPDPQENFQKAVKAAATAAKTHAPEMLVFPECFMCYFRKDQTMEEKSAVVKKEHGHFLKGMQDLAAQYKMWMIFGTYEPAEDPAEIRCYNTVYVVDAAGRIAYKYRKTHLYDAFANKESDFVIPGDRLCDVLDTPLGKTAVLTCYEARFPEIARKLAVDGAEVLIHPTAWVDGKLKEMQYSVITRTRAVENTVWFISADQCDRKHSGSSAIIDPMGQIVSAASEYETVLNGWIDPDRVSEVRKTLPVLENRRPELY